MSNLKNNFASKLTSVSMIEKGKKYVYTGTFEDGTSAVIRTSGRKYVSVTQISCHYKEARTDFLFSAKPTPSLGKNEQNRVIATVQVTAPAPEPVVDLSPLTNALATIKSDLAEQHRLEHSGDGDCDRHPLG